MLTSYSDIVNDWPDLLLLRRTKQTKMLRAKNLISGQKNTSLDGYNQNAGYCICKQRRENQGEYDRRLG